MLALEAQGRALHGNFDNGELLTSGTPTPASVFLRDAWKSYVRNANRAETLYGDYFFFSFCLQSQTSFAARSGTHRFLHTSQNCHFHAFRACVCRDGDILCAPVGSRVPLPMGHCRWGSQDGDGTVYSTSHAANHTRSRVLG